MMEETDNQDVQQEQDVFAGPPPLDADQIKQIAQGNQALKQVLERDPALMDEIEAALRELTAKPVTRDTFQVIQDALRLYVQDEALDYLLMVMVYSSDDRLIEQARAHATPETWNGLRRLLALFGSDIREIHAVFGENENDWRNLNRRLNFDALTNVWAIALEIIKFDGSRAYFEVSPRSALILAQGIVDTLNGMPPQAAPDVIDQATIDEFLEQCTLLAQLFVPGMYGESEEEGEPAEELAP
jgi:hypothetical protein